MSKGSGKTTQESHMPCIKPSGVDVCPPKHLVRAAVLYILVLGALWFIPTYLYHRISETGQAVVLTLVDSAVAELQSLTESKIGGAQASLKNGTLVSPSITTTTSSSFATIGPSDVTPLADEQPVVESSTESLVVEESQSSSASLVDEVEKNVDEEDEMRRLRVDEELLFPKDEEELVPTSQAPRIPEIMTTAPELNDTAARAQLIGDDSNGVIFDSLVTSGPTEPHEDIPSFSEWTQKRLEEAEKKKSHPNVSVQNPGGPGRGVGSMKIRLKNYASPDCGAKVVAANPESRSARSVLVAVKDEYMLNTCTSRVWFVVELCEAIQAKKIELANFELFSSSPKDFTVYVSDRYPTRDWSSVGQFTARDEKDIQSFNLYPHLFGKFVKVELQSHHGSEHFCPISLFRVYGTSEFEVLETETENHVQDTGNASHEIDEDEDGNNDEEELFDGEDVGSRNLFGSATDAVINIVKKATQVLVKSGNSANNGTEKRSNHSAIHEEEFLQSCGTPKFAVQCRSCSNQTFFQVVRLLTCQSKALESLADVTSLAQVLKTYDLCHHLNDSSANRLNPVSVFFSNYYIIGLCNMLAIKNRKVELNPGHDVSSQNTSTVLNKETVASQVLKEELETPSVTVQSTTKTSEPVLVVKLVTDVKPESQATDAKLSQPSLSTSATETVVSQIKPTRTILKEELKKEHTELPILLEDKIKETEELNQQDLLSTLIVSSTSADVTPLTKINEESPIVATLTEAMSTPSVTVNLQDIPIANQDFVVENGKSKTGETNKIKVAENGKAKTVETKPEDQLKVTLKEEEAKISIQETNTFDSILSDLLENDALNLGNGQGNKDSSTTQPTINANTPQQKESVFLRLSNRIKALERNMSLSSQYLEELSRRYKKQVEEMQRSLERAVSAMAEEARKSDERDAKRLEEISQLRSEMSILTQKIQKLTVSRWGWNSLFSTFGEHIVFGLFDAFIIITIFYYFRRVDDYPQDDPPLPEVKKSIRTIQQAQLIPGKRVTLKKPKKRRPSEVASSISGTYQDLMIEDRNLLESKERRDKDKKKKRKKLEETMPGGNALPSRRVSSNDAMALQQMEPQQSTRRPDSAPSTGPTWPDGARIQVLHERSLELANESDEAEPPSKLKVGILKHSRFASPAFMRSALRSRSKRMSFKLDSSEDKSDLDSSVNGNANGHVEESDESGSTKKKSSGLRKMKRRLNKRMPKSAS